MKIQGPFISVKNFRDPEIIESYTHDGTSPPKLKKKKAQIATSFIYPTAKKETQCFLGGLGWVLEATHSTLRMTPSA